MSQLKYVIFNGFAPVLFHDSLVHKDIVQGIGSCSLKPTGAEFYHVETGQVYGASVSLGMGPGKHDAAIIRKLLGGE